MSKPKKSEEKKPEPFPGHTPQSMPVIVTGAQASTTHPDVRER